MKISWPASVATASDFPQITLSQVRRREALGFTRLLGAGALVDRVLRFFTNHLHLCQLDAIGVVSGAAFGRRFPQCKSRCLKVIHSRAKVYRDILRSLHRPLDHDRSRN
jgi:hypothetical protein